MVHLQMAGDDIKLWIAQVKAINERSMCTIHYIKLLMAIVRIKSTAVIKHKIIIVILLSRFLTLLLPMMTMIVQ